MDLKIMKKWGDHRLLVSRIVGGMAFLSAVALAIVNPPNAQALGMTSTTTRNWQQSTVSGTVTDESGVSLAGVNVKVRGSARGTTTDSEGKFVLEKVAVDDVLVFSYVGYKTQEVPFSGRTVITVVLTADAQMLEELVVMGYGVQQKKLVTGSTVEIKGEDIQKRGGVISPLAAMQGQSPGVSITSTGGRPGSGFRVNIRGMGTVGGTTPLFVVDGVQTGDIAYLNASDIQSIDVLKDAATAAIYGARAANGVILITTKQGKAGYGQVYLDSYYGVQNASKRLKVLDAPTYMDMMNEMYTNSGLAAVYPDATTKEAVLREAQGGTDWMDLILNRNVPMQSHSVGGQGGTEASVYALSLSYLEQGGLVGGSDLTNYKRTSFRINSEHKLYKDILKIGQHLSYTHINNVGFGAPVSSAIRTPSVLPNRHPEDPSRFWYNNTNGAGGDNAFGLWSTEITNPYANMVFGSNNLERINKVLGDVYADLQIIPGLRFRSTLSIDYSAGRNRSYEPLRPNLSAGTNEKTSTTAVTQVSQESMQITSDNILNYITKIDEVHEIDAMIGMSALKTNSEYLSASNRNLRFQGFEYAWLNNASGTSNSGTMSMSGYPGEDRLLSYFGRVNYNFKGTYMASVILRSDGSSRFDKNYRRGYFPSFSAGWNVTNEPFMEGSASWLNFMKIRASWGQNGNMNIPPYYYLALISSNFPYSFGGDGNSNVGSALTNASNASLNWEKAQSFNAGFDANLFNGGLNVTFDFYNRQTRDWLVRANVPTVLGVDAPYINGGNVVNKGVELSLAHASNPNKNFNYSVSGNIAYNKNLVSDIPTQDGILHGGGSTLYANSVEVTRSQDGYPLGYFWGLATKGIFQNEQEVQQYAGPDGSPIQPNAKPGDLRYIDRNGDGEISADDKTMIGSGHPDLIFGLNLNFGYKGFDLYIAANGAAGNEILQNYIDANRTHWNITQDLYDGRWHGEGTSNRYPRLDAQMSNWINFSDAFMYKGDYLKINNVTLGYDFAHSVLKLGKLSQLRLYATAQNLYSFTSYNGMDPEVGTGSNGVDQSEVGRDSGMYPNPRIFLFGVNIKF